MTTVVLGCPWPTGGSAERALHESAPTPPPPLRIGTSGDYPPFSDWPPDAPAPRGFSIDLARAWAEAEGRSVAWRRFQWPELAADLAAGRFDLVVSGVTVRPDRSITGRFSLPLTTSGAVALIEPGGPMQVADLDHPDVGIAVNAGGHLEAVARRRFPRARIEAVPDNGAVLGRLDRADVQAVITDSLEAPLWRAKRPELRALGPLTRDRKAAWLPIGAEQRVARLDRWLIGFERSGGLAALRARHGLPPAATAAPVAALLARLDERLSLMPEVARAKRRLGRPVEDRAREERVIAAALETVRGEAARRGVDPLDVDAVRRLYVAQIEAAKQIQRDWLAEHPAPGDPARAEATPGDPDRERAEAAARLEGVLRPALLFLGERIATVLVEAAAEGAAAPDPARVAEALARHGLPPQRVGAIARALDAVLSSGAAAAPPRRPAAVDRGSAPSG